MLSAMRVQKDDHEQARRSAMRLDGGHQAARVHDFGLIAGDEASLQNNDVLLLKYSRLLDSTLADLGQQKRSLSKNLEPDVGSIPHLNRHGR